MKLRSSLSAVAGLLLWANASHACDTAHVLGGALDVVQQQTYDIIAPQAAASLMAIEAELGADADRIAGHAAPAETWTRQSDLGAYVLAVEAELAADPDRGTESALSMNLVQEEKQVEIAPDGLPIEAELVVNAHRSAESVSDRTWLLDHEGESFAFVTQSRTAALAHPSDEQVDEAEYKAGPKATGSTLVERDETELALDGIEDR